MSRHADLLARHRKVMPDWIALYYDEPIALERGEGRYVWDAEGNRYLDLFGGILTTMTGHNVPEITAAITQQAGRILHSSTLYLIEQQIELAEQIAELAPIDNAKVFFTSSGSEANDCALMLATGLRRSNQVLALRNSYHGRSFAAVAVTGNQGWRTSQLSPIHVSYIHNGYKYRSPFGHLPDDQFIDACVADLRSMLETTSAGDVACMIAEPIQGVGGFATPPDGFFAAMKEELDRHGILFIADEVQTGWGRTGEHFWGIDAHGVRPDIMTFAKGLGNGLAIGGVVARAEILDSLGPNSISTFGGNPLSTAGALANLRYLRDNDLQANALRMGERMFGRIREAATLNPAIGDVRGKGLMIGVELVEPGTRNPDAGAASRVMEECKARNVLIGKGGLYGNALRIAPPLSITEAEVDEGLDALCEAITAATGARQPAAAAAST